MLKLRMYEVDTYVQTTSNSSSVTRSPLRKRCENSAYMLVNSRKQRSMFVDSIWSQFCSLGGDVVTASSRRLGAADASMTSQNSIQSVVLVAISDVSMFTVVSL